MKEIGDCAKEWADKALDGPPVADINWLLRTAFISGAAEQAKRDGTYPQDDHRPSDPAELARQVAVELRKRGIWAHVDPRIGPVVYVPAAYGSVIGPGLSLDAFPMFRNDFDNLGPVAIADEIQAAEVRRAQEWAGDSPC